jgi:acetyl-CoA carboxylase carboxyltransferase component
MSEPSPGGGLAALVATLQDARRHADDASRPDAVAAQHAAGRLTARERIGLLFDAGSFTELGALARSEHPDAADDPSRGDGLVIGDGTVDGRRVVAAAYDFTYLGGSFGLVNDAKLSRARKLAIDHGLPLVMLLEGGGARVQERMGAIAARSADRFADLATLSGWAPIASAVLGPTFAGHANLAGMSDFVVMTRGASLGVAGPRLVKAATREDLSLSELGADVHATRTGVIDARCEDDAQAIAAIRRYLAYLPSNASLPPPRVPCAGPDPKHERLPDALLALLPDSDTAPYRMGALLEAILDPGSLMPLRAEYGRSLITAFARLDGRPVGVVANDPSQLGGVLDVPSSAKMSRFISLCDAFGLPLLFFVDTPGFMVGRGVELAGIVRHAVRPLHELGNASVPILTVIVRKAYGLAFHAMGHGEFDPDLLVAWPSAQISPMGIEGAVDIAYRRRIRDAVDPVAERALLVERMREASRPMHAAESFRIDDVIDPRDTRSVLARALERALERRLGGRRRPPKKHGVPPW